MFLFIIINYYYFRYWNSPLLSNPNRELKGALLLVLENFQSTLYYLFNYLIAWDKKNNEHNDFYTKFK